MNLLEAAGHVGCPVICRDYSKIREGVVRGVSEKRQQVRVEMRYTARRNYQLFGRCEWWHLSRLAIPQWCVDRHSERKADKA